MGNIRRRDSTNFARETKKMYDSSRLSSLRDSSFESQCIRTLNVRSVYLFGSVHAVASVIVPGQADHHRERRVLYPHVVVLSLQSADAFLDRTERREQRVSIT